MCEKCVKLDREIDRYKRVVRLIGDPITVARAKEAIADMLQNKAELHPPEK